MDVKIKKPSPVKGHVASSRKTFLFKALSCLSEVRSQVLINLLTLSNTNSICTSSNTVISSKLLGNMVT